MLLKLLFWEFMSGLSASLNVEAGLRILFLCGTPDMLFLIFKIMVTHGLALASWKVIDLCILPFQNGPWLQFLDLDSARSTTNITIIQFGSWIWFQVGWVLPSHIVAIFCYQKWIRDMTALASRAPALPVNKDLVMVLSEGLFSAAVLMAMVAASTFISVIPGVGFWASLTMNSLIYSYSSFDHMWSKLGVGFGTKCLLVERKWAFFLGFGVPCTLLSSFFNGYYTNASIFYMVSPWCLIFAAGTCGSVSDVQQLEKSCRHLPRVPIMAWFNAFVTRALQDLAKPFGKKI